MSIKQQYIKSLRAKQSVLNYRMTHLIEKYVQFIKIEIDREMNRPMPQQKFRIRFECNDFNSFFKKDLTIMPNYEAFQLMMSIIAKNEQFEGIEFECNNMLEFYVVQLKMF